MDSIFEFLEGAEHAALRLFLVSFAKKLSTALSQEADVGVKWKTNRGWFSIHSRTLGCFERHSCRRWRHRVLFRRLSSMTLRNRMNS